MSHVVDTSVTKVIWEPRQAGHLSDPCCFNYAISNATEHLAILGRMTRFNIRQKLDTVIANNARRIGPLTYTFTLKLVRGNQHVLEHDVRPTSYQAFKETSTNFE